MKIAAIIAAAGIGRRMGGGLPKQYLEIGGRPIICHTLDRFREAKGIGEVIVVVEPGREAAFREEILKAGGYPSTWRATAGGKLRQESVANGLALVPSDCDVVLVHDGVRPFVTAEHIERAALVAARDGACIIASPIRETVKRVGADGMIQETVDREHLWGAQTPQGFLTSILKDAVAAALRDGFVGTDEASLVERMGAKVTAIDGDARNIKITTPSDLAMAEGILKEWR
ncbi:MAG: 2-C-methyl-D-erythritol 4-phosphate cytidylyltransferase [Pseudomonadota bacterium]